MHAVLENLFDLEPEQRSWQAASSLLLPEWETLAKKYPDYPQTIESVSSLESLLTASKELLRTYFMLERPKFVRPASRESVVEARLESGLLLRGIIDRVDQAPDGRLRVVDYKTGRAPSARFIDEALFQMRFYALLLAETKRIPTRLQLLYLKDGQVLTLDPQPKDIEEFESYLHGLWQRIAGDLASGEFAPRRTPLCNWCPFQSGCPLYGGVVEPAKQDDLDRVLTIGPAAGPVPSKD